MTDKLTDRLEEENFKFEFGRIDLHYIKHIQYLIDINRYNELNRGAIEWMPSYDKDEK